jgi:hypothetical protein
MLKRPFLATQTLLLAALAVIWLLIIFVNLKIGIIILALLLAAIGILRLILGPKFRLICRNARFDFAVLEILAVSILVLAVIINY